MKIIDGKYTITNPNAVQGAMNAKNARIQLLQAQLDAVKQWASSQLEIHQPYTHGLDLSCHSPEKMAEALGNKLKKDVWCSRCRNPWPCKHIGNLRVLRDLSRSFNDIDELKGFVEEMNKIEPKPERVDGQIDVRL